jgi:putative FmdB family regulatory protein
MPTYRYKCPYCHECFEVDRKISEYSPVEQCPNCSGDAKRVFTPIGTIPFEGSYNKDNRGR